MRSSRLLTLASTSSLALAEPSPYTGAFLVLDRSSSMRPHGNAPCVAMNKYLAEVKASPEAARIAVQITTFDANAQIALPLQPILTCPNLEGVTIGWGTRFYSTMVDVMRPLKEDAEEAARLGRSLNIVVAGFTDGYDGRSAPGAIDELRELSAFGRAHGWELLLFGFGVNATWIAEQIGFPTDEAHAKSMDADVQSIYAAAGHASEHTRRTATGHVRVDPAVVPTLPSRK
jgi:hypothetical protein